MSIHHCSPISALDAGNIQGHEPAIFVCEADDNGFLWVSNNEYSSRVNFCPYCGFRGTNTPNEKIHRAEGSGAMTS